MAARSSRVIAGPTGADATSEALLGSTCFHHPLFLCCALLHFPITVRLPPIWKRCWGFLGSSPWHTVGLLSPSLPVSFELCMALAQPQPLAGSCCIPWRSLQRRWPPTSCAPWEAEALELSGLRFLICKMRGLEQVLFWTTPFEFVLGQFIIKTNKQKTKHHNHESFPQTLCPSSFVVGIFLVMPLRPPVVGSRVAKVGGAPASGEMWAWDGGYQYRCPQHQYRHTD